MVLQGLAGVPLPKEPGAALPRAAGVFTLLMAYIIAAYITLMRKVVS
jgi:hypothetical protein